MKSEQIKQGATYAGPGGEHRTVTHLEQLPTWFTRVNFRRRGRLRCTFTALDGAVSKTTSLQMFAQWAVCEVTP